jgi:hypothetical protein
MSKGVIMATTPGNAAAAVVSMAVMVPEGMALCFSFR